MLDKDKLTGTQLNYFLVCHRKLWLFSHGIEMERENEAVQLGKQIGARAYGREKKEVDLQGTAVLDWVEHRPGDDGVLTVHEVKKSRAMNQAHRLQMLSYLDHLREKGVAARGVIDYPEIKARETVELDDAGRTLLQRARQDAARIVQSEQAPPRLDAIDPGKIKLCLKCAYCDFCYAD